MIYLDNAATSWPKPDSVHEAMVASLRTAGGNPGRGSHALADAASRCIADCRLALARFIRAGNPRRLILTSGTTEGLNLVLKGLLKPGDRVVTSSMEHNSVMRPLNSLARHHGVEVVRIRSDGMGYVDLDDARRALSDARVLVLCHASNVCGTLQDLPTLTRLAHEAGAKVIVDAAQTLGIYPFALDEIELDALVFSGHKGLMGPHGTGAVYLSDGIVSGLRPWIEGGTGSHSETLEQPQELPDRFESGTQNLPGFAGLRAAVEYVERIGVERIAHHEVELAERLWRGIAGHPRLRMVGPPPGRPRTGIVSFTMGEVHPADIGAILDGNFAVAVRAGLHCAPVAHTTLGTFPAGTVRLSVGHFTTDADVDAAIAAVIEVADGL